MKRLYISIFTLLVIAVLSTASVIAIKKGNEQLSELVHRTEKAYLSGGDPSQSLDELEEYWQDYYLMMTYITAPTTLEDMAKNVARLPYLLQKNSDDFLAELKSIEHWAQLMYDTQFPDLSSIF